jgi:hypothetical protein
MVVFSKETVVVKKLLCVQSTGGSTGEDEDETQTAETRRNTQHNEQVLEREPAEVNTKEHCLGADLEM